VNKKVGDTSLSCCCAGAATAVVSRTAKDKVLGLILTAWVGSKLNNIVRINIVINYSIYSWPFFVHLVLDPEVLYINTPVDKPARATPCTTNPSKVRILFRKKEAMYARFSE
jgi:hypothetical protein